MPPALDVIGPSAWPGTMAICGLVSVDQNGANAYVHRIDPTTGASTLMLTVPLGYTPANWFGSLTFTLPQPGMAGPLIRQL
ncbi:MAG: hypothetical protein R2867_16265 [Caldilineaceae bacterium]